MAASELALLKARVETLEAELVQLKRAVTTNGGANRLKEKVAQPTGELPWWEQRWGLFANDPDYDAAMELGRKYRESLRPKATKTAVRKRSKKSVKVGKRRNVHS